MLGEPQIANDLRIEQAHGVARGRVAKARMEFLGDRGATDNGTPFDDMHLEARRGEVAGAGQTVVTRTDNDDIQQVSHGGHLKGGRASDAA